MTYRDTAFLSRDADYGVVRLGATRRRVDHNPNLLVFYRRQWG